MSGQRVVYQHLKVSTTELETAWAFALVAREADITITATKVKIKRPRKLVWLSAMRICDPM